MVWGVDAAGSLGIFAWHEPPIGIKQIFTMENSNQFIDLTEQEMLELYKTLTHLTTVRRDCTVERDDGIDLDAWLTLRLQQWYAQLLATGQQEWLPIEDVKDDVTLAVDANGAVRATVPPRCVRPVEWRLQHWLHSATTFLNPSDPLVRLQLNPWTRGNANVPAAVDHGDHLLLFSAPKADNPLLTMARCVVRPADGHYRFHAAALSTLPPLTPEDTP